MISLHLDLDKWLLAAISIETESARNAVGSKYSRLSGTAIFFQLRERYYLITARHVVADHKSANELDVSHKIFLANHSYRNQFHDKVALAANDIDISLRDATFLLNLSAGPYLSRPYVLSSVDQDVAVIDISARLHSPFAETLLRRGYVPIVSDDIDGSDHLVPTQEISAIGFCDRSRREALHRVNRIDTTEVQTGQIPHVTSGRIVVITEPRHCFEADIHLGPGMYGGPVVANDRMVGMFSRIESVVSSTVKGLRFVTRQPVVTTSSVILHLLTELLEKQKLYPRLFR